MGQDTGLSVHIDTEYNDPDTPSRAQTLVLTGWVRWTECSETSSYVCQVALSAADFAEAVRPHWTIENRNHHVHDVTLGEDHSRIRVSGALHPHPPRALNIFRANDVRNAAQARYAAALNPDKLMDYAGS